MLSPARPSSRSLRNISTPGQTVFVVGLIPTISPSSLTFTIPRSTRPGTTVPRTRYGNSDHEHSKERLPPRPHRAGNNGIHRVHHLQNLPLPLPVALQSL